MSPREFSFMFGLANSEKYSKFWQISSTILSSTARKSSLLVSGGRRIVRDAGLGNGLGAGDAEGARGGKILHLADHRRLDTLAGGKEVDRLLREVAGALGRDQDHGAAAIGHQAALQ
jgi:hypothetical protein